MLLKYCHDFFDTLIAIALDLPEVFLNLSQVDGFAIALQQSICVPHQKGLQLFTTHFLYRTIGIAVDYLLFCHIFTSFILKRKRPA